jgi:hypothetical protein
MKIMADDNPDIPELEALEAKLREVYDDFRIKVADPKSFWNLHYGPLHVRARMSSQRITGIFISFCLTAFVTGALATFVSATRELGIALVIGAIFTGGSFLIQYWSSQVDKERDVYGALEGELERELIAGYAKQISHLVARIESIDPKYFSAN